MFEQIILKQREFFRTHKTKDLGFRQHKLEQLKKLIQKNDELLYEAIAKDFGKSRFDTYTTEISFVLKDIDYYLKNLKRFAGPRTAGTNMGAEKFPLF